MKALSIRQPWAWLIIRGHKDIENRTWLTNFRGKFLIHAGKKFDYEGYNWVLSEMNMELPEIKDYERGGIVGSAKVTDCVALFDSPWFFGPYGFVICNPKPLPFLPFRGRLGFFEIKI
jgi:hypothetical protein